jgi:DNA-directed RNA polymerase subunit RPC12/RpoP
MVSPHPLSSVNRQSSMVNGPSSMVSPHSMVVGQSSTVQGRRSMVNGRRSIVNGQWSSVNRQWSMVVGQSSTVNGHRSIIKTQLSAFPSQSSRHSSPPGCVRPFFLPFWLFKATFGDVMGLLDLDKIIIKRTILGIRCTACGGNLVISGKQSVVGQLTKVISLGTIRPTTYECETCKKRFVFFDI